MGVDRNKHAIQIPLPPRIDPTVTMMTVEEKPDVTYADIGGMDMQKQEIKVRGGLSSRTLPATGLLRACARHARASSPRRPPARPARAGGGGAAAVQPGAVRADWH